MKRATPPGPDDYRREVDESIRRYHSGGIGGDDLLRDARLLETYALADEMGHPESAAAAAKQARRLRKAVPPWKPRIYNPGDGEPSATGDRPAKPITIRKNHRPKI
jgi:hypothetical protein